ncbi:MAG: GDSL-type esterase/lipase family protein [Sediminibacterium sp.]|jgi:lysophospholipase L1-like esterase|nr:GDSL-type esterase/lipase family protein [Sediminibacterium sp.]
MKSNSYKKASILIFLLIQSTLVLFAQNKPFEGEIKAFAKSDSIIAPLQGKIVFAGSSSFTKWKDINQYFPGYPIINRGFGGSNLLDVILYVNETILKYKPKQVVIYCGENDLASSDTVSPEIVLDRFSILFNLIREQLGNKSNITFVSIKPSISRWRLEPKILAANALIANFIAKQTNANYINIHDAMLEDDGTVMKDIFIADKLHMNAKGYAIWQKIIAPSLLIK